MLSWGDHLRKCAGSAKVQSSANCYHEQWMPHPHGTARYDARILSKKLYPDDGSEHEWIVNVASGDEISLNRHGCDYFSAYDTNSRKPIDRVRQEQRQRRQDARDNRRFRIADVIGGVTALAVIASAFFHWLEWNHAP